jgi:hypothetical protein
MNIGNILLANSSFADTYNACNIALWNRKKINDTKKREMKINIITIKG